MLVHFGEFCGPEITEKLMEPSNLSERNCIFRYQHSAMRVIALDGSRVSMTDGAHDEIADVTLVEGRA